MSAKTAACLQLAKHYATSTSTSPQSPLAIMVNTADLKMIAQEFILLHEMKVEPRGEVDTLALEELSEYRVREVAMGYAIKAYANTRNEFDMKDVIATATEFAKHLHGK